MTTPRILITLIILLVIAGGLWYLAKEANDTEMAETPATSTPAETEPTFGESVDYTITGIEPGAGIMINTETAMQTYGLSVAGWNLQESSSAAMLSAFQDAVANNEPIVATVWEPHALFAIADIRKLDDPQNVYNDPAATRAFLEEFAPDYADAEVASDVIASVVYQGFAEDAPAAYEFLQEFNVPSETQSEWIYDYNIEEMEPETIAEAYVSENAELVDSWTPDDAALGKETLTIGIPPWPGVTVKSAIVEHILEDMGYTVEVSEMDVGVVYTALAEEEIDINLAGWLPSTHGQYWDTHSDVLEIAGINVTTTWLGLGVPDYVDEDVQSLEDLAE